LKKDLKTQNLVSRKEHCVNNYQTMILPPVETTPLILLRFSHKVSPNLVSALEKYFELNHIITLSTEYDQEDVIDEPKDNSGGNGEKSKGYPILSITTTEDELELEAEKNRAVLPTAPEQTFGNKSIMEEFTVVNRNRFLCEKEEKETSRKNFTSGQRINLCLEVLEEIPVLQPKEAENEISKILKDMKIDFHSEQSLIEVLQDEKLLESVVPLHFVAEREKILNEIWRPLTPLPTQKIRDYYGDEVAFYFVWLSFFTMWLTIPAIGGIIVYSIRTYNGDTIDTCEITPFFGFGVFLWASFFVRFWERRESTLAYHWGTYQSNNVGQAFQINPEFEGTIRISPVTDRAEKYYSPRKRRLKYVFSAFVTLVMLGVAFVVMIISLNLQGYVRPDHDEERWGEISHPYYYPWVAHLSESGQLFDCNSTYMSLVPAIFHALTINTLNSLYRKIAERLTKWENHKTLVSFENSMILKRFLFEAFDCYIALFYLAFFERDIKKLRGELGQVFIIDTFRRMFLECIVPMVQQRFEDSKSKSANADRKKNDDWFDPTGNAESSRIIKESTLEEYEEFDDYLEMVISFGYITLFASAIPLASSLAIFSNLVEIRTDSAKLARVLARPRFIITDSIGIWKALINVIVTLSALTNCLIFGMTSGQMAQYFPEWFYMNESGDRTWIRGKGYMVILVIVGIERFLLLLKFLVNSMIPKVPMEILEKVERCEYVRLQESKINKFEVRSSLRSSKILSSLQEE